ILTMMLNDKDTGAPLALMSANLLSAARTGAVPAVAVRHLANQNAKSISVIGCGPINKACVIAIMTQLGSIEKAVCFDLFLDKARDLADWMNKQYGVEAVGVDDAEAGFREVDVITIAASRLKPLHFKDEWIKNGATILISGPVQSDESFWTDARIVYDHTPLHEAYVEDAIASGNKDGYYTGIIGGPFYRLIDAGKLQTLKDSIGLGDVVNKQKLGRQSPVDRVVFIACGMSVFDISWGYEIYLNAKQRGIGTRLRLWDKPHLG
ncbi:MAG: ornithine cyclodeaminase, partial [Mesorhizobium sp.]